MMKGKRTEPRWHIVVYFPAGKEEYLNCRNVEDDLTTLTFTTEDGQRLKTTVPWMTKEVSAI